MEWLGLVFIVGFIGFFVWLFSNIEWHRNNWPHPPYSGKKRDGKGFDLTP